MTEPKPDPFWYPLKTHAAYLGQINLLEWLVPPDPKASEEGKGKAWQQVWGGESYPTAEEAEQIREDRARGFSFKALMGKYDVSHETLDKILRPGELQYGRL